MRPERGINTMSESAVASRTWAIDTGHSVAEFSAKHMVVSTVKGVFREWSGTIVFDESNPAASSVEATLKAASIDTGIEARDNHLRSDDFFNAEQYPTLSFKSTSVVVEDATHYAVTGLLVIRDVAKPVTLNVEYDGQIKDAYGKQRAAFTAETTINRKEFNLNWNGVIETGGVVVSDKIKITLHIAAVAQD